MAERALPPVLSYDIALQTLERLYPGFWALWLIPLCAPDCPSCPEGKGGKNPHRRDWNEDAARRHHAWAKAGRKATDRQRHLEELARHIAAGNNIGLVLPPGTVALDLDSPAQTEGGRILVPGAPMQGSSEGHCHLVARYDEKRGIAGNVWIGGVSTTTRKGGNAQIVAAPSRHASGAVYSWWGEGLPLALESLPKLPDACYERAPHPTAGRRRPDGAPAMRDGSPIDWWADYIDKGLKIPHGSRRDFVRDTAWARSDITQASGLEGAAAIDDIEQHAREMFAQHCEGPDQVADDSQFRKLATSAVEKRAAAREDTAEQVSLHVIDGGKAETSEGGTPNPALVASHPPPPAGDPSPPLPPPPPAAASRPGFVLTRQVGNETRVLAHTLNVAALLTFLGAEIRLNEMTNRVEFRRSDDHEWGDLADGDITWVEDHATQWRLPTQRISRQLEELAATGTDLVGCHRGRYHPVVDWIHSRPWDGQDRFGTLASELVVEPAQEPLRDALLARWLVSLPAVLTRRDVSTEGVLTLQGRQGIGKTTWFRRLIPDVPHAVVDGLYLDPTDKDSRMAATSAAIVELGEVETMMRRDLARLKAFLTLTEDQNREPYARKAVNRSRRTVFAASVNQTEFLSDEENRRFWVVPVLDVRPSGVDMQQVWAQALAELDQGGQWWLTPEERTWLGEAQEMHRVGDPIEELIMARVGAGREGTRDLTVTQLLADLGHFHPSKGETIRAGRALTRLGYPPIRQPDRGRARVRRVPELHPL